MNDTLSSLPDATVFHKQLFITVQNDFTCPGYSNHTFSKVHLQTLSHQISHKAINNHDW